VDQNGSSPSSNPIPREIKITAAPGEKVAVSIELAESAQVTLQVVKQHSTEMKPTRWQRKFTNPAQKILPRLITPKQFMVQHQQVVFIVLALLVYLTSRFIGLDRFPIYFFTDEAIQTNSAADLITNELDSNTGEFLPTYFVNGSQYNLDTSVYIQVLPTLFFGKSIWVTRGVCVFFTLLAALGVGLFSRNVLHSRFPALAVLILSVTPAWFLHSRTAFETALAVSFFAAFLYCYAMYRQEHPKYLLPAILFAALTFYSYSPAQLVMLMMFVGLFFSDLRYHLRHWKSVLPAFGVGLLCTLPYVRFLIAHPEENFKHLQILNSYWTQDYTLLQKLGIYFKLYLQMLNPYYWFGPEQIDLVRHLMKGYGNLLWWSLPIVLLGLALTLLRLRKPEYRLLLLAILAAPSGAALASVGITRTLFMVIPATLLATLALDQIMHWLSHIHIKVALSASVAIVLLLGINGYMVQDVLTNAPTWYTDYGLAGMQYGARQLFGEVKEYLQENPDAKLTVSSAWANGSDVLARYFFKDPAPFQLGSIEQWMIQQAPLDDQNVFVVIPEEMRQVQASNKFKSVQVLKTLPYPDGNPGFYFVKVSYVDNIAQVFAEELAARHALLKTTATLPDGTSATIQYPKLDMGNIPDIFDGNDRSLIRTAEANPLILKFTLAQPIEISQVTLRIGGAPSTLALDVTPTDGSTPLHVEQKAPPNNDYRDITLTLGKTVTTKEFTLTLKNSESGEPDHVHLWEVSFK
jgi:hypothetical protein